MSFFSWLRNPVGNRARRARPRAPAPRFRPRLEALEGRCVPTSTTLKVTSYLDSGPGSLRYEIAQAQSGDTIIIPGNKNSPHTITLTSGELLIKKNLTITGPGAGLLTVTSTGSYDTGSRIFEVDYGTVSLSGMTISNGNGYSVDPAFGVPSPYDDTAGAVLNFGRLTISGCTLSGNRSGGGPGGAIANFGTLAVSGCTLSNNSSFAEAGGIYNASGGTLTVSGCTLSGNFAFGAGRNQGGGIFNYGTLSVSNSTLSGNTAYDGDGGGVYNAYEATLTASGCTLSGNSAYQGGGIYNDFGGATLTVSGCTLSGNTAGGEGGGIYNAGTASALTVNNSMFSSNTPDNVYGPYTDGGGNTFQ